MESFQVKKVTSSGPTQIIVPFKCNLSSVVTVSRGTSIITCSSIAFLETLSRSCWCSGDTCWRLQQHWWWHFCEFGCTIIVSVVLSMDCDAKFDWLMFCSSIWIATILASLIGSLPHETENSPVASFFFNSSAFWHLCCVEIFTVLFLEKRWRGCANVHVTAHWPSILDWSTLVKSDLKIILQHITSEFTARKMNIPEVPANVMQFVEHNLEMTVSLLRAWTKACKQEGVQNWRVRLKRRHAMVDVTDKVSTDNVEMNSTMAKLRNHRDPGDGTTKQCNNKTWKATYFRSGDVDSVTWMQWLENIRWKILENSKKNTTVFMK